MASIQSTYTTPKHEPIDIGRRLREIFDERKLSLRAFASYYGSSKDVIHRIMTGGRLPTKTELVKIAHHLKITYERLMMVDTHWEMEEMTRLIQNKSNLNRAIQLATKLLSQALGYTERFTILNKMGVAYHQLNKHEKAHNTWLEALPYARKVKELHNDSESLTTIIFNLILSHRVRGDYLKLACLLDELEPELVDAAPQDLGDIMYYRAWLARDRGDLEFCHSLMYQAAEVYMKTGKKRLQEKAKNNMAFAEYVVGNYHKAEELYLEYLESFPESKDVEFDARKGYVQTLLKVKRRSKANLLIEKSLNELDHLDMPNFKAAFLLLQAYSQQNIEAAKCVLDLIGLDKSLYLLACKYLMEYCEQVQDSDEFMKYHQIAGRYREEESFQQEVFQF